jgi:MYXO-CTERM domain-containing protein
MILVHCAPKERASSSAESEVRMGPGVQCAGAELLARAPNGFRSEMIGSRVARDGERLYWTRAPAAGETGAQLESIARDGTDPITYGGLFESPDAKIQALDGEFIYVVDRKKIVRFAKTVTAETKVEVLFEGNEELGSPGTLRLDGDQMYFAGGSSPGYLAVMPKSGGAPAKLLGDLNQPFAIGIAPQLVYVETYGGRVKVARTSNGPIQDQGTLPSLTVDDGFVYSTHLPVNDLGMVTGPSTLDRTAHGDEAKPSTLYSAPDKFQVSPPILDGDALVFGHSEIVPENPGTATLKRMPKAGGEPTDLVVGLQNPRRVFADEEFIYWLDAKYVPGTGFIGSGFFRAPRAALAKGPITCTYVADAPAVPDAATPESDAGEPDASAETADAGPESTDAATETTDGGAERADAAPEADAGLEIDTADAAAPATADAGSTAQPRPKAPAAPPDEKETSSNESSPAPRTGTTSSSGGVLKVTVTKKPSSTSDDGCSMGPGGTGRSGGVSAMIVLGVGLLVARRRRRE